MIFKLKDLGEIITGNTPSKSIDEYWDSPDICFVKPDIIDDSGITEISESSEHISEAARSKARIVGDNALFVTCIGSIGKIGIAKSGEYAFNQQINAIVPNKMANPRYLAYAILHSKDRLSAIANAPVVPIINKTQFGDFELKIDAESDKQAEIVHVLDTVAAIMEMRRHQLYACDELIKARFVEMFGDPELNSMGWPTDKLGSLLSIEPQNGLYKPQSDYVHDGTGTPILRIDAFYDGKVTGFSRLKRLNCTDAEKCRYLLHENDIVINRVNSIEYLGKCAWITGMTEPTVFESNMMRFHADESIIDPCYLTRLLCSTYIYNQILNRAKKAVNQASINQGDVQSLMILIPSIDLQRQFASFVSQIDKSKAVVQAALDKVRVLFDSLMQKYFG